MSLQKLLMFRNNSIRLNFSLQRRLKNLLVLCLTVVSLLLLSCQSSLKNRRVEYVDTTSDLVFPKVPVIHANSASELTEAEFQSLILYMIEAEKVFDIIAEREGVLDYDTSSKDK